MDMMRGEHISQNLLDVLGMKPEIRIETDSEDIGARRPRV